MPTLLADGALPSCTPRRRLLARLADGALAAVAAVTLVAAAPAQAQSTSFSTVNWSDVGPQPHPNTEAQGKAVGNRLYSFGGFDSLKPCCTPTKRAYAYDPATNTWSAIADLPHTPSGANFGGVTHAGVATDGTDLFLAGGYTSNSNGTGQIFGTRQVWQYVVATNRYVRLPDLPAALAAGQLEYVDGRLHFIGGTNAARTTDLGTHYVLDLRTPGAGWVASSPMPNPRHHAGSAVLDGKIYIVGGQHAHDSTLVAQRDVHVFDPATAGWTRVADLPVPAGTTGRGHVSSAVAVFEGNLIVFGGETRHGTATAMVSAYTPADDRWRTLTWLPTARMSGVAGTIGGRLYYTTGSNSARTFRGIPVLTTAPAAVRVNAGGGAFVTADGRRFEADRYYGGTDRRFAIPAGDILNTTDDALYRDERSSAGFSYRVPVPNGNYRVVLHFAELWHGAPNGGPGGVGKRRFHVDLEGVRRLTNYDITAKTGGAMRATQESFTVAVSDGAVDLLFSRGDADWPELSALEIVPVP